ncbi:MAG: hypothetical protein CBB72_008430 [Muricauda sp. TMED12]|nr:MAG: hypothetical protein CBB72_008430 [Muricauda sp. TMED12]
MNENDIRPNTFLIGAQKSATTSLYNWIAQHPDVCGPESIKDYPFFIKEELYEKGIESLKEEYIKEGYSKQKIVLQGSVQYMFFEESIDRIYSFDPNSKLILVLRNPVDRAISAYNYFKKLNIETLSFPKAIAEEEFRLKGDLRTICDLTYISHGYYFKQLSNIYKKFSKEQVLVLFFDDVNNNPDETTKEVFKFLEVSEDFKPNYKRLNVTGSVRFKVLQNLIFNKSKTKKILVDTIIDPLIPLHKRTKLRWWFKEWNTKKENINKDVLYTSEREELKLQFREDIEKLENLLRVDLSHWK